MERLVNGRMLTTRIWWPKVPAYLAWWLRVSFYRALCRHHGSWRMVDDACSNCGLSGAEIQDHSFRPRFPTTGTWL